MRESITVERTERTAIEAACPEHMPELLLSLNAGIRLSEQYSLRWENVSFTRRNLSITRSKNGAARHVPLNQAALGALEALRQRRAGSEFVCGGAPSPRRWFEPAVKDAEIAHLTWHCLRHTFPSRLVMAGVDIRTVQEFLGHKTIATTVRYFHLAPKHTLAAVEHLDIPSESPTDTTTDTGVLNQEEGEVAVLQ